MWDEITYAFPYFNGAQPVHLSMAFGWKVVDKMLLKKGGILFYINPLMFIEMSLTCVYIFCEEKIIRNIKQYIMYSVMSYSSIAYLW